MIKYNEGEWVTIVSCDEALAEDGCKLNPENNGVGVLGTILEVLGYNQGQNAYVVQEHGQPRQWGPYWARNLKPAEAPEDLFAAAREKAIQQDLDAEHQAAMTSGSAFHEGQKK